MGVISAGGAIGAVARYSLGRAVPVGSTGFPWATFIVNVSGCVLIGVLMVLVSEVWPGRRLLRPFLGVGVLGGYTTFSTYIVDIQRLTAAGAVATALAYLAGTLVAALLAVYGGVTITRTAVDHVRRSRTRAREVR
nr:CrcB family protein [Planosporangium thailandense]